MSETRVHVSTSKRNARQTGSTSRQADKRTGRACGLNAHLEVPYPLPFPLSQVEQARANGFFFLWFSLVLRDRIMSTVERGEGGHGLP